MPEATDRRPVVPDWFTTMIALTITVCAIWFGRDFLMPLAITGLLFILTSALVDGYKRARLLGQPMPGWLAKLLSAATVLGGVGLLGWIISSSGEEVQAAMPRYEARLSTLAGQIEVFVGPQWMETFRAMLAKVDIGSWVAPLASGFAGVVSVLGLVVLYLAFLLTERTAWTEKLPRLAVGEAETLRARKVLNRISEGVKQYMWVNAVTSAMSAGVAFLIFSWIGLDFAALLAVIVFVVGFIPNIGAFIGIALPSLVALLQFDTLTPFFVVLFGYGLADQFIANVIQPAMQGRSLNLSAFMVMVSLTFWATVWGGIGAFLAIPMMVVTMVVCSELPAARWIAVLLSSDGLLEDDESRGGERNESPGGS